MLTIDRLQKTYPGGAHALKDVTLRIPAGVFGLLGPNGAGKSTLMNILATLLQPDTGSVRLLDTDVLRDPAQARRMLGYLPQDFGLYPTFTARQILDFFARLKGITSRRERAIVVDQLLEIVNLTDVRDDRVGKFSGGMLQRVGIAQAMLASPQLLIVDEPTAGLDPEERARFHNILADIAANGTVVILSTHLVSEVANVCGALAILLRGEILAACTPSEALAQLAGRVWETTVPRENIFDMRRRAFVLSGQIVPDGNRVRVLSRDDNSPGPGFTSVTPTLDDFYMSVVASRS